MTEILIMSTGNVLCVSDKADTNFLTDDPIGSDEEDAFQHTEYVDALERILESVDAPWHIGIFGKWGSGKTSIIRLLFNRIRGDSENGGTVCIEFDAWKHAEDSVRTELLLTLDQELGNHAGMDEGLLGEDEITGQLYDVDEQKKAETDGFIEGIYNFVTHSTHLLAIIIALGILAIGASVQGYEGISTSLLVLIAVPLLVFMAEQLQTATTTLQRKFVYPRKEWSGAYERIFQQLVSEAQSKTETNRIIISIDNLDRCQSRTVYEVLVSLKTFMDIPPCIYIIPCDDEALKSHIQQIDEEEGGYFDKGQNTSEFLRKFFQTTIRIPPMLPDDIEVYAEEQNAQLKHQYDSEVLDVLTKAYIKTPRRIKQGLNRVTALYMIAEEIEESETGLEPGRVTNHPAFLAKIAILEEDYPQFYGALQDDPRLLDDVDRFFTGDLPEDREQDVKNLFERTAAETSGVSNLRTFLKATRATSVSDIKPFLHLSEPQYTGSLDPNFVQLLRTNQTEEVEQILDDVDEGASNPFDVHCEAIEGIIDEYDQEGRDQALFSTIESILDVFNQFDEPSKKRIANAAGSVLTVRIDDGFVEKFNPEDLVWLLDRVSERRIRRNLFHALAETVVSAPDWSQTRLRALVSHTAAYENEDSDEALHPLPNRAKQTLAENLLQLSKGSKPDNLRESEFGQALNFIREEGPAWSLLTQELFEPVISRIDREQQDRDFLNADFYVKLDKGARREVRGNFVECLIDLAPKQNENQANRAYINLSDHLLGIEAGLDTDSANTLFSHIQQIVNSKNSHGDDVIETGFYFYESASEDTREQFHETVSTLIEKWGAQYGQKSLDWAVEYEVDPIFEDEGVLSTYLSQIPDKFSNSAHVSNVLSEFSRDFDAELNEKVKELIDSRDEDKRQLGAEIFTAATDRFEDSRDLVVEKCLRESRRSNTPHRKSLLLAVASVFDDIEESDQQTFVDRLEDFLDERTQNDYRAFSEVWDAIVGEVDPRYKRQVANSIIEVLEEENRPPEELVRIFYSLTDDADKQKLQRCIEIMVEKIGDVNENHARSIFDLLADAPNYMGSENAVITRIESFLNQHNTSNSTDSVIGDLLTAIEKRGNPDDKRIEEIRTNEL